MSRVDASVVRTKAAATRFRNLIVHRYWDVDDQRVLEIARTSMGDLEAFLEAVGRATGVAE